MENKSDRRAAKKAGKPAGSGKTFVIIGAIAFACCCLFAGVPAGVLGFGWWQLGWFSEPARKAGPPLAQIDQPAPEAKALPGAKAEGGKPLPGGKAEGGKPEGGKPLQGDQPAQGGKAAKDGGAAKAKPGPVVTVTADSFHRVKFGMNRAEVNQILGSGKTVTIHDVVMAYGGKEAITSQVGPAITANGCGSWHG
jgi:hypothetical protein